MLRALLAIVTALAAGLLIATSTLVDLRSLEGTERLGTDLADDAAVRELVGATVVDALLEDAAGAAPEVSGLLPLVRPLLEQAVGSVLDAPAGRSALAVTLTDAARQLTFAGPVVLDLRPAVLAAAEVAPEPLATLARSAVARGSVGLIVLGGTTEDRVPGVRDDAELSRVGGLAASTATTLAWALLGLILLAVALPGGTGRAARLRAAGTGLAVTGATTALILRSAPGQVVDQVMARLPATSIDGTAAADGGPLAPVLPVLVEGLAGLLSRTADLTLVIAGTGAVLLVIGGVLRPRPGPR